MIRRKIVSQAYPFYYRGKDLTYILLLVFVMSFFFNYFFEPFNVYRPEHKFSFFWISFIHSSSATIAAGVFILLSGIWISEDKWTVGREILFLSSVFLIIGLSQFLIRDIIYDNPNNWSWHYLFEEIRNTFLVGILFTLILVPLNFMRLYTRHQKISQKFPPGEQKQDYRESENILIKTNLTADDFYLDPDQIIFARAEGNYLEIFLDKEEASKPLLKRVTLKKFEQQLNKYPFLVKTHRSYMVNLHKIVHMKGNAQGYRLKLNKHDQFIPVSRSMIEKFEEEIRRL